MQSSADVLRVDQATTERVKVLVPFGLTERQARFLATVMLHSGVFVGRQYAAFAGITHGQKVHDFIEKLRVRRFVTPIQLGSTGRTRIFHVHHKPLYAAIGEPDNRNRRRVTIDRAIERLMGLDGVLAARSVTWLGSEREKRRYFRDRLGDRLRDDEYPRLVFGKRPNITVRYFPDKLPIGHDRDRYRQVFIYLARSPTPTRRRARRRRFAPPTRVVRAWPSGLDGACAQLAGRQLRVGLRAVRVDARRCACQEIARRCVHRITGHNVRDGSAARGVLPARSVAATSRRRPQ